jgi:hypothetical protein
MFLLFGAGVKKVEEEENLGVNSCLDMDGMKDGL